MADEKDDKAGDGEAGSGSSKKTMVIASGGGGLLLGLAFLFAMMGVPGDGEEKAFMGPFVAPLTAEKVQVNLLGGKGYLILDLNVVYQAYEESYFTERSLDPLTIAEIRDALVTLASAKSKDDISDKVSKPIFMEEIRVAVEPLLFPVLIGDGTKVQDADSKSGLAFGHSSYMASFRGAYEGHVIHLDVDHKTLRLDDGPEIEWEAGEDNLEVVAMDGTTLFFDLTHLDPSFDGEVKIGVMGHPTRVLLKEILTQ